MALTDHFSEITYISLLEVRRSKANVDSGHGHKQVNLQQYRRLDGRWQFIQVVRKNGKPDPRLVLIDGEPASSKGGHFFLAWREEGKLKRQAVGSSPREALNAWHVKMGILAGDVEPEPEPETAEGKIIVAAIAEYLRDVKATKSAATYKAYKRDLAWFRENCKKYLESRLARSDVMILFTAGREESLDQKTTNKRVVVMLQAMRGAWADIHYKTAKISVSTKQELKFTPKSYEIRSVEVPTAPLAKLKARQKKSNSVLVFPAPKHPTRRLH
jgi:hypothetical protein